MKKIFVLSLVVILLTGCQQGQKAIDSAVVDVEEVVVTNKDITSSDSLPNLLNAFNDIIETGTPYEARAFLDEYMPTASELDADIMLTMYVDQQRAALEDYSQMSLDWTYQRALVDAYDKSYNLEKLSRGYSDEIMSFLTEIKKDGFLLNYHEGIVTIYPDYNQLQNYENFVSGSILEYINILSRESSEILSADGGLTISWSELSFRALSAEGYLKAYPSSIRYDEVLELYKWYLNALLTGLPDTPIYYRNSKLIRNDVLQTYNKTIIHNADTITSTILKAYLDIIRTKNNKVDAEALDYVRVTLKNLTFSQY
jgi:hypothetical protein